MATIAPIVASRGIDPGAAPSTARDDSVGAALRGVGSTLGQVAGNMGDLELRRIQQAQSIENFQTEQAWARTKLQLAADYDQAKLGIDPSGQGFAEGTIKAFNQQYDAFLKTVPERLRPEFAALIATDKEGRDLQAAADEVAQRNAWYEVGVTDTVNEAQTSVASYPEAFEQTLADVHRTIDATGLPTTKKADLKRTAEEMLGRAWFEAQLRADPTAAKSVLGVGADRSIYYAAIRQAESSGDDSAKNENSSATGRYQFTDRTWAGLMKRYPGAGLTGDGRTDPRQQEAAIRLFTMENEQALKRAGIEGTNANLYAAHFLGAQGAIPVLSAPNGAAMAGYVSAEVIAANPFLKSMTVGQFKRWAAEKAGGGAGGTEPASQVAILPFAERVKLYDQAAAAESALATQQRAAAKLAYDAEKGGLELAIEKGEVASAQTILDANLDDGDKATLLSKWNTRQAKDADARAVLDRYSQGLLGPVNPYDADQRRVVGDAYDLLMKSTPDDQKASVTANFVSESGVVPDQVVAAVRRNLNATDVAMIAAGLQQAATLQDVAANGLQAVEHGKEITEAATSYREMTGRGMSVEQAAGEIARNRDPAQREKAEVLEARWKQEVKDNRFPVEDVLAQFDAGLFGGGKPLAGVNPYQSDALAGFYLEAAERAFKGAANGDSALAKQLALAEVKQTFNVSETSGERSLMKYPPELFYPAREGGHRYLRDMVVREAKSIAPDATDAYLLPDDRQTGQDIRAGRAPRYNLFYVRPDGTVDMAPGYFEVTAEELQSLADLDTREREAQFALDRAKLQRNQAIWGGGSGKMGWGDGGHVGWGGGQVQAPPEFDPALQQKLQDVQSERIEMLGRDKPQMATSDPLEDERRWLEQQSSSFGMMGGAPR